MALREEIVGFTDADGLVAPNPVGSGEVLTSDNGTMFTSEYFILLSLLGELRPEDASDWRHRIAQCFKEPGLLCRNPIKYGYFYQEGPDNYYGVLAASSILDPAIAEAILTYGQSQALPLQGVFNYLKERRGPSLWLRIAEKLFGRVKVRYNYNNTNEPGINGESWLGRQLPLVAAMHFAAHKKCPLILRVVTALVIATSCIKSPLHDSDARRLAFLLIVVAAPRCWMSRLASKIWYLRLKRDYPGEGMRGVAKTYYQGDHPFKTHFPV